MNDKINLFEKYLKEEEKAEKEAEEKVSVTSESFLNQFTVTKTAEEGAGSGDDAVSQAAQKASTAWVNSGLNG